MSPRSLYLFFQDQDPVDPRDIDLVNILYPWDEDVLYFCFFCLSFIHAKQGGALFRTYLRGSLRVDYTVGFRL